MDFNLISGMLSIAKSESEKRYEAREKLSSEAGDDVYLFQDMPFLNELYLLILVFVWHQVEKDLVLLAARADTATTSEITVVGWKQEVLRIAKLRPPQKRWQEIRAKLAIDTANSYDICYNILRPLANSWKHDPFERPSGDLFQNLGLDPNKNYARHPESDALRDALCQKLGILANSGYFEIAEAFVESCRKFLQDVEAKAPLRAVERRPMSLDPDTFER